MAQYSTVIVSGEACCPTWHRVWTCNNPTCSLESRFKGPTVAFSQQDYLVLEAHEEKINIKKSQSDLSVNKVISCVVTDMRAVVTFLFSISWKDISPQNA